jgi:hypothetical protein
MLAWWLMSACADAPAALALWHLGAPVVDGDTWTIEAGAQGLHHLRFDVVPPVDVLDSPVGRARLQMWLRDDGRDIAWLDLGVSEPSGGEDRLRDVLWITSDPMLWVGGPYTASATWTPVGGSDPATSTWADILVTSAP